MHDSLHSGRDSCQMSTNSASTDDTHFYYHYDVLIVFKKDSLLTGISTSHVNIRFYLSLLYFIITTVLLLTG